MIDKSEVSVDKPAPGFTLPASNGRQISLSDYLTKNNVYLFFVREFE